MSSADKFQYVSPEDYLAAEELSERKHEYIDGWVRAMTGATKRHCQVTTNCVASLWNQLKGKSCRVFSSDLKLRIQREGRTRFYYPDAQVICESNKPTDVYQEQPVLIIEVLSPSTRQYDLDEKLSSYLQIESLQAYVILEHHQPQAIVMRRTSGGFLREVIEGIDASISLPFIGCSLAIHDIYDGIEFTPTCVQEPEEAYDAVER